jgi:hypothetical protein
VQTCGYELCVVNQSVLICVDHFHRVDDIFLAQGDVWNLFKAIFKFFNCELSITIHVHLRKRVAQVLNLVFGNARRDETQSCAFQLHGIHVVLHVNEDVLVDLYVFKLFVALLLDPRMLVRLLGSESHVCLPIKQLGYQILCLW